MIMSRFLFRVFGSHRTKFIFTSRHPVANAMSQLETGNVRYDRRNLRDLVLHWIRQHEILFEDMKFLPRGRVRIISLNEIATRPREVITELWNWILQDEEEEGIGDEKDRLLLEHSIRTHVHSEDPDRKWREKFCEEQKQSRIKREEFAALVRDYEDQISTLVGPGWFSLKRWGESCSTTP